MAITRTFSKSWGAAGCRVGYLLGKEPCISEAKKVRLTYPVSNVSIKFVSFLMDNPTLKSIYVQETVLARDKFCLMLKDNFEVINSASNSIHFHEKKGDNERAARILSSHGIAFKGGGMVTGTPVRIPGDNRETWIRLAVGPKIDQMPFATELCM